MAEFESFNDHAINESIKNYDEIRKIAIGQEDDYTTGCLLYWSYFKKYYQLIAGDLSKQKSTWHWSNGYSTNRR